MIVGIALAAAASATSPSTVCKKLAADFDTNEYAMAATHDFNQGMYQSKLTFAQQVGNAKDWAQVDEARKQIRTDDEEHLAKADRVITLMLANKCAPPDHVASWYTYSDSNPNKKVYQRPNESD